MKEVKNIKERRRFLKYTLGLGTAIWLTPSIITLSAKKGHACLSGGRTTWDNCIKDGENWWDNWNNSGTWYSWDKNNCGGKNGGRGSRGRGRGRR